MPSDERGRVLLGGDTAEPTAAILQRTLAGALLTVFCKAQSQPVLEALLQPICNKLIDTSGDDSTKDGNTRGCHLC